MKKFGWTIAIALLLGIVLGLMFSGRNAVTAAANVVNSFNTRSGNVTLTSSDVTSALTFAPANQADLTATNTNLADNYFTKAAADSRFALFGSSYTKTESDAKYAASGQVVTGLNNLTGGVTLNAGSNVTITPSGNTLTISASTSSSSQPHINPLRVATLRWYEGLDTGAGFTFGQPAVGLAFDGAHMWTTVGNSLVKIRPSDCVILGSFSTQAFGTAGPLAFDGANMWVGISDAPLILKFRASDGALIGTFSLSGIAQELAFDGQHIFATSGTKLFKLRPSDGVTIDTVEFGTPAQGLAIPDSWVWVTLGNGTVVRVHRGDSEIIGPYNVGIDPRGIAFDGANVWIANSGNKFVTKLRGTDGAFLGNFNISINIGNPIRIAFDGAHMWVTTSGGRVERIRVSDGVSGRGFSGGTNPAGIAFDGINIWVAHSAGVNKL